MLNSRIPDPFDPQGFADFGTLLSGSGGLDPGALSKDYLFAPDSGAGMTPTTGVFGKITPAGGIGDVLGRAGFGLNPQTFNLALGGLQTLGGLWASMKALDVAKKQLAFSRATSNANLANQTQSYNTQIADRARARGAFEGQSQAAIDDYIARNSLPNRTI